MILSSSARAAGGLLALSVVVAGCSKNATPPEDVPPSVILISLDTLRYDHCGFNGGERDTTPFLDEFAKQCLAFDRAYSTMSWTLIAHMSMLTGMYPTQHGVMEPEFALSREIPGLAERLSKIGYTTLGVHFPGWLDPRFGFDRGFKSYESAENIVEAGEAVGDALESVRPGFPYFLFVHLFDIHSGDLIDPSSTMYATPAPFDSIWVEDAKERLTGIDMREWWDVGADPTIEQLEALVALYDGGIRYVDSVLDTWFAEWEERGLLDNTLVIITSDHGEGLFQRGKRFGGHGDLFEEGLRIPMLVRWPDGSRAGERSSGLVSLVDIVPTVMDVVELPPDERLPGFSLAGPPREEGDWVFAARSKARAAVSLDRKVLYNNRPLAMRVLLLDEDPMELEPIRRGGDRKRFKEVAEPLLEDALERLGSFDPGEPPVLTSELDDASRARLEALGYGGEVGDK
ncbi:MAG: sulfatase [Planctomycetota bacterium]